MNSSDIAHPPDDSNMSIEILTRPHKNIADSSCILCEHCIWTRGFNLKVTEICTSTDPCYKYDDFRILDRTLQDTPPNEDKIRGR
jgi:hypothetical protein